MGNAVCGVMRKVRDDVGPLRIVVVDVAIGERAL